MASPEASSSSLSTRRVLIIRLAAVIAHRITGWRGRRVAEAVMFDHLSVWGGLGIRPWGWLGGWLPTWIG